jgi:hypothetical protein
MWTAIERDCVYIYRDDASAGHARSDLRECEKFIARAKAALKTDFSRCARTKKSRRMNVVQKGRSVYFTYRTF